MKIASDQPSVEALAIALKAIFDELDASLASARTVLAQHGPFHAAEDIQDSAEDIEAAFLNLGLALRAAQATESAARNHK